MLVQGRRDIAALPVRSAIEQGQFEKFGAGQSALADGVDRRCEFRVADHAASRRGQRDTVQAVGDPALHMSTRSLAT